MAEYDKTTAEKLAESFKINLNVKELETLLNVYFKEGHSFNDCVQVFNHALNTSNGNLRVLAITKAIEKAILFEHWVWVYEHVLFSSEFKSEALEKIIETASSLMEVMWAHSRTPWGRRDLHLKLLAK
jgi:hypothetical protein